MRIIVDESMIDIKVGGGRIRTFIKEANSIYSGTNASTGGEVSGAWRRDTVKIFHTSKHSSVLESGGEGLPDGGLNHLTDVK